MTKGGRFSANAKMPSLLSSGTYFLLCAKNNDNIDNVGDGEDNQIHENENDDNKNEIGEYDDER